MPGYVKRRARPAPGSIPAVLDMFRAEVRFYREIAPVAGVRVPACYQASETSDGTVLVLEDLSAWPEGADPVAAAGVLAGLHARWRAGARALALAAPGRRGGRSDRGSVRPGLAATGGARRPDGAGGGRGRAPGRPGGRRGAPGWSRRAGDAGARGRVAEMARASGRAGVDADRGRRRPGPRRAWPCGRPRPRCRTSGAARRPGRTAPGRAAVTPPPPGPGRRWCSRSSGSPRRPGPGCSCGR